MNGLAVGPLACHVLATALSFPFYLGKHLFCGPGRLGRDKVPEFHFLQGSGVPARLSLEFRVGVDDNAVFIVDEHDAFPGLLENRPASFLGLGQ